MVCLAWVVFLIVDAYPGKTKYQDSWDLANWLENAGAIVVFPLGIYLAVRIVGWTVGWLVAGFASDNPPDSE